MRVFSSDDFFGDFAASQAHCQTRPKRTPTIFAGEVCRDSLELKEDRPLVEDAIELGDVHR